MWSTSANFKELNNNSLVQLINFILTYSTIFIVFPKKINITINAEHLHFFIIT